MQARVFRKDGFVRIEVTGPADLEGLLRMIRTLGTQTQSHGDTLMLVNLQGLGRRSQFHRPLFIGEHVAQYFAHLTRLASVVQVGKITRTSEKVARAQGLQLSVFDSERDAMAWLLAPEPHTSPAIPP